MPLAGTRLEPLVSGTHFWFIWSFFWFIWSIFKPDTIVLTAMTGAEFEAPGVAGALLTATVRASLVVAGASAVPVRRLLGVDRYRRVERRAARLAWEALGADLRTIYFHHARGGPFVGLPLHESLGDPLFLARDEL